MPFSIVSTTSATNEKASTLPPPEMYQQDEDVSHPAEMYPVRLFTSGMLDEFGGAFEKMSKAQAENKPDDHSNVAECFHSVRLSVFKVK